MKITQQTPDIQETNPKGISRRTFLQRACLLGGGLVLTSIFSYQNGTSPAYSRSTGDDFELDPVTGAIKVPLTPQQIDQVNASRAFASSGATVVFGESSSTSELLQSSYSETPYALISPRLMPAVVYQRMLGRGNNVNLGLLGKGVQRSIPNPDPTIPIVTPDFGAIVDAVAAYPLNGLSLIVQLNDGVAFGSGTAQRTRVNNVDGVTIRTAAHVSRDLGRRSDKRFVASTWKGFVGIQEDLDPNSGGWLYELGVGTPGWTSSDTSPDGITTKFYPKSLYHDLYTLIDGGLNQSPDYRSDIVRTLIGEETIGSVVIVISKNAWGNNPALIHAGAYNPVYVSEIRGTMNALGAQPHHLNAVLASLLVHHEERPGSGETPFVGQGTSGGRVSLMYASTDPKILNNSWFIGHTIAGIGNTEAAGAMNLRT